MPMEEIIFLPEEVEKTLVSLYRGKAAGPNEIHSALLRPLRKGVRNFVRELRRLVSRTWENDSPSELKTLLEQLVEESISNNIRRHLLLNPPPDLKMAVKRVEDLEKLEAATAALRECLAVGHDGAQEVGHQHSIDSEALWAQIRAPEFMPEDSEAFLALLGSRFHEARITEQLSRHHKLLSAVSRDMIIT
ncbi:unnamed protein product [Echinostoma caproni]|uniref:Uncharacterized protein n=1 Tax=Echinostoma caproni TaxID=27848 RepID=A0A183BB31_9TREM|nr:unnamed protein product [Echinostoma caproni]